MLHGMQNNVMMHDLQHILNIGNASGSSKQPHPKEQLCTFARDTVGPITKNGLLHVEMFWKQNHKDVLDCSNKALERTTDLRATYRMARMSNNPPCRGQNLCTTAKSMCPKSLV